MTTLQRISLRLICLACGLLVFMVFSHYYPFYKGNIDKVGRIVVAGIFLVFAIFARFNKRSQKYWLTLIAFFGALTTISINRYLRLSKSIPPALGKAAESPAGWGIGKLESSLLGIVVVLAHSLLVTRQTQPSFSQHSYCRFRRHGAS